MTRFTGGASQSAYWNVFKSILVEHKWHKKWPKNNSRSHGREIR